jgi:hypothetical protein
MVSEIARQLQSGHTKQLDGAKGVEALDAI